MVRLSHDWPSHLSPQQESKLYQSEYTCFKIKTCKVDEIGIYDCVLNSFTLEIRPSFFMDCETDISHVERTWQSSEGAHWSSSNVDTQKMICGAYGLKFFIRNVFDNKHSFMRSSFCSDPWLGVGIQFYESMEILVFK